MATEPLATLSDLCELALEASDTGVWTHNLVTGEVYWDERAYRILGHEPGVTTPSFEAFIGGVHPEDRAQFAPTGFSAGDPEFDNTFRIVRPDGAIRHVRSRGRFLFGPDGRPELCAGLCQDVTHEIERQEERTRLLEQLLQTQKLESLGLLAGGVAHDFNNLLVAILVTAEHAKELAAPDSEIAGALGRIEAATHQAAKLAQQMLAYSGRARFEVQPVDLSGLVQEMAQLLTSAVSKSAEIRLELATGLPPVEGDPTQLRQVIMNLVTNAAEALDGGPGTITIGTRPRSVEPAELREAAVREDVPAGEYVALEVADTGTGMEQETLSKIFDPFFTTKFSGRGLGLAATLGIVRSHCGAMLVESRPASGTTFTVLLPALEITGDVAQPKSAPVDSTGSPPTILVVDDEAMVRDVACRVLRHRGYTVIAAEDGAEALAKLRAHAEIDLMILDWTMPGMNGDQVLFETARITPELPVILTSGYADVESSRDLSKDARAYFMAKPFTSRDLLDKVRATLAARPPRSAMTIRIRDEQPNDFEAIREVNRLAFGGLEEATIIDSLRAANAIVSSLVAVKGDRVMGHILFSPVTTEPSSSPAPIAGLGPMAVLPELQRRGVGSMLVRAGLDGLRRTEYGAVVVLGHSEYYPRFGFVPARRFRLRCEFECPEEAFMALELRPGFLAGVTGGVVHYRREFSGRPSTSQ